VSCSLEETKLFNVSSDRWFLSYATHRVLADPGATTCDVEFVSGTTVLGEEGTGGATAHPSGNGTVTWGDTALDELGERVIQNLTSSLAPTDVIQIRFSDPGGCSGRSCCFGQSPATIGPYSLEFNHWTENLEEAD
jgi:hypothetical protein